MGDSWRSGDTTGVGLFMSTCVAHHPRGTLKGVHGREGFGMTGSDLIPPGPDSELFRC